MNERLEGWLSIPKSLYVCLKMLPFKQAIRMPIKVRYNVKLKSLKGHIILPECQHKSMVMIGFPYMGTQDVKYNRSVLEINGTLEFKGGAAIGNGMQLSVSRGARLTIGAGLVHSCSGHIVCAKTITIGDNFFMGWETLILDTDFHSLENVITHDVTKAQRDVILGDNVWTGARCVILKGSHIADGCVIGANSVVSGRHKVPNCIIAGNPAKVIKEGYTRKE